MHISVPTKKIYLDLRRFKGYTELDSLTRDESKLTLTVTLKKCCHQKNET